MQILQSCELNMIRDIELVRDLLLYIEARPEFDDSQWIRLSESTCASFGKSPAEVRYHLLLLRRAGYIKAQPFGSEMPLVSSLTWEGHEFLGSIKNPGLWSNIKESLKGIPEVTIKVLAEVALSQLRKYLGLPDPPSSF